MTYPDFRTDSRKDGCRVDVYMPLGCRLVAQEEQGLIRARVAADMMLADFKLMPPLADHPHIESLKLLNEKLDDIIKAIGLKYGGFHSLPFKFVSLSAGGMKFPSQERYSLGDVVECKMILALPHHTALYVYGEVIRVGSQGGGYFVNIRFTVMDQTIQDRIIRFIFETEREMIRQKREDE